VSGQPARGRAPHRPDGPDHRPVEREGSQHRSRHRDLGAQQLRPLRGDLRRRPRPGRKRAWTGRTRSTAGC
jgi:hypothetical protein